MPIAEKAEKTIVEQSKIKGLVIPNYSGMGLANVAPTILKHFGVASKNHFPISEDFLDYSVFNGIKKIVLMTLDGFGYDMLLDEIKANKPLAFSDLVQNGQMFPLTSVSPSTTVTALSSLSTAMTPQEHGMLGYRMYLRELKVIMNMIAFENVTHSNEPMTLNLPSFFPFKTTTMHLKDVGINSYVITRNKYIESPMSMMNYRGSKGLPYIDSSDMFVRTKKLLEENHNKKTFINMYWDRIDSICHEYGKNSDEHLAEMEKIDFGLLRHFIEKLSNDAKKDTLLLITADHGHINVPFDNLTNLGSHTSLGKLLAIPPSGESRFVYFHAKKGKAKDVMKHLENEFGKEAIVMESKELLKQGFFGLNTPWSETSSRIGDVVLIPKEDNGFVYPYKGDMSDRMMIGRHGGMSKEEMLVPLIAARLG